MATLIKNAVRTNSWSAVESTLTSFAKNDANNIVQYIVGAVYKQCGKNEAELMKALALFPQNVREKMIQKVTEESGELTSTENLGESDQDKMLTYWNPAGTADMISRSMGQESSQQTDEEEVPQIRNSSSDDE